MSSTGKQQMSLKAQLDACRRAFEASTPPGIVAALQGSVAELVQTGLVRQAVKAGEKAPLFRLRSDTGELVALSEALDRGPVVVSFSQGGWCPFSRLELQALADAHPEIERLGATLIGLSPLPDARSHSSFPILTDTGCRIAARYRIAFAVPPQFRPAYLALGYPERLKKGADLLGAAAAGYVHHRSERNRGVLLRECRLQHAVGADRDRRGLGASSRESESKLVCLIGY